MMKSAKTLIEEKIKERTKKIANLKKLSSRNMTYQAVIKAFLKGVENVYDSKDAIEFRSNLDTISDILDAKMKTFDPMIRLELKWFDGNEKDYSKLRLSGIKIRWSRSYLKKNPTKEQEEIIDVADALFE